MIELRDWAFGVGEGGSPYQPPEMKAFVATGRVWGHHRYTDGDKIRTSDIIDEQGATIRTISGSVYTLVGPPRQEYVDWCRANGWRDPSYRTQQH